MPKKFRKKFFLKKCSCAIVCMDNLTRFRYPKCCDATNWPIFLQFDGNCPKFPKNQSFESQTKNPDLGQKNRSFDKTIAKKFGKKTFLKKCFCAIVHMNHLTRFRYPKCCEATYRTVFRHLDAFWTSFWQCTPYTAKMCVYQCIHMHFEEESVESLFKISLFISKLTGDFSKQACSF